MASLLPWPRSRRSSAARSRTPTRRRCASGCSRDGHERGRRAAATSRSSTPAASRTRPCAKSRQAAARAARTHRRVYVTGCGANLAGDAFAGLPANVIVVARPSEETPRARRRRRRRDRLRPGRRAARPRARVREDPGRLLLLVHLLRDPARARRDAQPPRRTPCSPRSGAGSRRATARSSSPGSTSAASATARPATRLPRLVREAGRRRRRSSGCGSRRSRSTTSTPSSSRRCARRRRVGRHLHVPLQSGDDGVLRAMGRRYTVATYLRRLEPLADFNLTADVIVGFPAEDERAFERTLATVRARRAHEGARLPVLAAPGHADGGRRPRAARGEEGAERAPARALARARAARRWRDEARDARTSCSSTGPGRGYGDDYSPWLVDAPRRRARAACAGARSREEGILAAA